MEDISSQAECNEDVNNLIHADSSSTIRPDDEQSTIDDGPPSASGFSRWKAYVRIRYEWTTS